MKPTDTNTMKRTDIKTLDRAYTAYLKQAIFKRAASQVIDAFQNLGHLPADADKEAILAKIVAVKYPGEPDAQVQSILELVYKK